MAKAKTIILILLFSQQSLSYEESWRLDSRFVKLNLKSILHSEYPNLAENMQLINNYASFYSINPFLLAEAISLSKGRTIKEVSFELFNKINTKNSTHKIDAILINNALLKMSKFDISPQSHMAEESNKPALDLPFNHSESWEFNGVHTWTGSDDGSPMSSIDIAKSWGISWGDNTDDIWVSAAHEGVVTVFSTCFIRITHESGWATDYYHLDNPVVKSGDQVISGQFIANYANNLAQATCQGGRSSGPHLHFALVKNGQRYALKNKSLSLWKVHPGQQSYDSNRATMWLEKKGVKQYAYSGLINHSNGDNNIDYRYSGIFSSIEINGHGVNINITQTKNPITEALRNILFIAFYTYDDSGNANFYVGNLDFDNWRIDETQTLTMIQTSNGDFSNLQSINFETDATDAGTMKIKFIDCSRVEINFSLIEPTSTQTIEKDLVLSKSVGLPDIVCNAPSISYN